MNRPIPRILVNDNFIVVDKPSGTLTVPGRGGAQDRRPCLSTALAEQVGRLWPVHRLDAEVSGLVLFARHEQAHRTANAWFESRKVHKFYEAWTELAASTPAGDLPAVPAADKVLTWESRLLRGKKRAYESPAGKPSQTLATLTGKGEYQGHPFARWRVEPLTGRSHQIRYELYRHGFPVLGDSLYGAKVSFAEGAIALRAVLLDFSECDEAKGLGLPARLEVPGIAEAFGV